MKKILALTLAAVMAAGMTTVAFAVDKDVNFEYSNDNNYIVVDRNDSGKFGDGKAGDADIDVTYNVSGGEFTGFKREDGGKKIAIVGQGRLVGKPLAKMWRNSGYDVTALDDSCHDLAGALIDKDVVVTATGVPRLIQPDMLKRGAVVVDAGVADDNGQTVGDLDDAVYARDDLTITPQKGGVGPLTIAALMDNVIRASYRTRS